MDAAQNGKPSLSDILSKIMANPELMRCISGIAADSGLKNIPCGSAPDSKDTCTACENRAESHEEHRAGVYGDMTEQVTGEMSDSLQSTNANNETAENMKATENIGVESDALNYPSSASSLISKLPGIISAFALSDGKSRHCDLNRDNKIALLKALKPYLNRRQCETIDCMINLSGFEDIIKNIT